MSTRPSKGIVDMSQGQKKGNSQKLTQKLEVVHKIVLILLFRCIYHRCGHGMQHNNHEYREWR